MSLVLLAAVLAATSPEAQEQDLRCIGVVAVAMGSMDPAKAKEVMPLAIYYIGRATGRNPELDLEVEMRRLLADEAEFAKRAPAEMARCGQEMQNVGGQLQRIGKALENKPGKAPK